MTGRSASRTTRGDDAGSPLPSAWRCWSSRRHGVWRVGTPAPSCREQLKSLQFWSLEACVVLGLSLGVAVLPRSVAVVWTGASVCAMAGLAALALALTLFVAPRTNRIYYDEQIYQGIGQNLADLRLAQMCNDGIVEYGRLQCSNGEYNKQPYAYPHLLSLAVPRCSACARRRVRRQCASSWRDRLRGVPARRRPVRRPRRRVLCRAARRADTRAARVVGDGRRRAFGLAGAASWRCCARRTSVDRGAPWRLRRRRWLPRMRSSSGPNRC